MMSIELVIMLVTGLCIAGGLGSYYWSEQRYGQGIIDGINMLDSGRLQYESYYEDDQKYIKIDIKAEDEE